MSLFDIAHYDASAPSSRLGSNRADLAGLAINAGLPVALWILALGVGKLTGLANILPHARYTDPLLAAFLWPATLALIGAAHWVVLHRGRNGHDAAHWLRVVLALAIAYPFAIPLADPFLHVWIDIAFLFAVAVTGMRVFAAGPRAHAAYLPVMALIAIVTLPSVFTLFAVWSPGFAATLASNPGLPANTDAE